MIRTATLAVVGQKETSAAKSIADIPRNGADNGVFTEDSGPHSWKRIPVSLDLVIGADGPRGEELFDRIAGPTHMVKD